MSAVSAVADEGAFAKAIKASLVFREESTKTSRYSHLLKVYLRMDNISDSSIDWMAMTSVGIKAELLDDSGNPVPHPPTGSSVGFGVARFVLPYGSRLDWLISHGGVSMAGDDEDKFALIVGGQGWLIPIDRADTYTLRIRAYGIPWSGDQRRELISDSNSKLLIDLPPTKIKITKDVEQAVPSDGNKPSSHAPSTDPTAPADAH